MSKGDFKRLIENIYIHKILLGEGGVNTCIAPNIHFCTLLINMNGKNFFKIQEAFRV